MGRIMVPTQLGTDAAALPFTMEELAPSFPQLEIMECLGRGGMGVVYRARQKSLNRSVALKLIAPERADDADFARRFEQEAQALAALNHQNIVAVHDFGQAGGFYFLLMEYVDGLNLRQLLQSRRLTPTEALSIVPPICDALQCAHARGIVHRDIKPENLLLDRHGVVKIADFGIAKMMEQEADSVGLTQASLAYGSTGYASPEQQEAALLDHRADIYSLGVVLYEMLTGERPKETWEPPSRRVQVDIRLDEIVHRALEKSPELRFATAADFRTQIEIVQRGSLPRSHWNSPRKAAVGVAACLLAAGAAATLKRDNMPNETHARPAVPATSKQADLNTATNELSQVFSELLESRKAQALETASDTPPNQARAQQIQRLQQRMEQLQALITELSNHSPPPTDAP